MKIKFVTLLFLCLLFCGFTPRPVKILMAGDSTMADKPLTKTVKDTTSGEMVEESFLERGWGQLLPQFVSDKAVVVNYAKNGRSTRTFIEEGLWTQLIDSAQKGDIVLIQFGHNDSSKEKTDRYTNPVQFRLNFTAFVVEVKAKGAIPVLCTPVARRKFDEQGNLVATHGEYPNIIRQVARKENVQLIDMEKLTSNWLQNEGVENSKHYFHKIKPGISKLYPNGLDDNTHFNEAGARKVAEFFINEIEAKNIKELKKLLK
ncbi:MAG: rhamnogalacturonan acetylesterase [Paludibacteraceae bacterium]